MRRMPLPCWGCGAKITVDNRAPADGLAAAGWVLDAGEAYCRRCAVERGLKGAPAGAVDGPPIGFPEFRRPPGPEGYAFGDLRIREALARPRSRGGMWIAAGVAAVVATLVIGLVIAAAADRPPRSRRAMPDAAGTRTSLAHTNRPSGPDGPIPTPAGTSAGLVDPVPGAWTANGTVMSSAGSGNETVGGHLARAWWISRQCSAGSCAYSVVRQTAYAPLRARLRVRGSLWYARFPPETVPCGASGGRRTYWRNQTRFLFRFSPDGRTVTAGERNYSYAPACGYGLVTLSWTGSLVDGAGIGSGGPIAAVQATGV